MSLIKKLSLEYFGHILVVFQGLKDFTYIAFKGLLCGNFVDLAIHHMEWMNMIWNFPRITESLPFDNKTKFGPLVIHYRDFSWVSQLF